jgi:ArsR family transcriptional regulator, arsenate/arsenite/antimonite-responsive transcriptional repressor
MNPENILAGTASLFLALGDKTRLRLLNLMRDREICVSSFIGTLGHSQPLVSRHLAYLRNTGIVEARRDGKWMHYSISTHLDANTDRLLAELFKWMEGQDGLRQDREQYQEAYPAAKPSAKPGKRKSVKSTARFTAADESKADHEPEPLPELDAEETANQYEPVVEPETFESHHNELEDFLL